MRKFQVSIIAILLSVASYGNAVVKCEYFLNSDPGYGNGTPVGFESTGDVVNQEFVVELPADLPNGVNTIYFRSMDDQGHWSQVYSRTFLVENADSLGSTVVKCEYFINADPGYGEGIPVGLMNQEFVVELPEDLGTGLNTIYFRSMDDQGHWSQVYSRTFLVENADSLGSTVVKCKYFINADPGYGEGIPVGLMNQEFVVELPEDLGTGLNTIYFRSMDDQGHWSQVYSRTFLVENADSLGSTVVKCEYFINADPGYGEGIPVGLMNQEFVVELPEDLGTGLNTIYFRCMDDQGHWSQVYSRTFLVENADSLGSTVVKCEYFINADPGYGEGIPVGLMNQEFVVELPEDLGTGLNTIYFWSMDDQGHWSQVYSRTFLVENADSLGSTVVKCEYFINADPGYGEGIPVGLMNQEFVVELPEDLGTGLNTIYFRCMDDQGHWSQVYSRTFILKSETELLANSKVAGEENGVKSSTQRTDEALLDLERETILCPNPTTGEFSIHFKQHATTDIEIYNMQGKLIYSVMSDGAQVNVDLSGYPKGVYNVQVTTGNKQLKRKVIIN